MRIGLNLLHAMPSIGGGWNYISNLIGALGRYDVDNTYVAFVTDTSSVLVPAQPNFISVRIGINPVSRAQRVTYENTVLQLLALHYGLDCMHWFANVQAIANTVPSAVTVYDLLPIRDSVSFSKQKRVYLRLMMSLTAKRARILLPMSSSTANDLRSLLGASSDRMTVVPPVLDTSFAPAPNDDVVRLRIEYNLPDRFWLYVAHTYPHKNHCRLLEAYASLPALGIDRWPLVLRGDPNDAERDVQAAIARFGLQRDVIRLPKLDYRDLPSLYTAASAFVFPSLFEGGGIPVIEAMACGCPIASARIPSVVEFADDAAYYFDPSNIKAITDALLEVQSNDALRLRLRSKGLDRASLFASDRVASILVAAYRAAVSEKKAGVSMKGTDYFGSDSNS